MLIAFLQREKAIKEKEKKFKERIKTKVMEAYINDIHRKFIMIFIEFFIMIFIVIYRLFTSFVSHWKAMM